MRTRVLLVDDHQLLRLGIQSLFEGEPSIEVVGEAADGRAAVELAGKLRPHIVLMDVTMPRLNGAAATRQILSQCPRAGVIALSMHSDGGYVAEMLNAGASGYLLKTCDVEELLHAIKAVRDGKSYLSPDVTGDLIKDYVQGSGASDRASRRDLTGRETEVLQLLAEGNSSKEIARLLHVSVKTVTTHRQNIMDKLQIRHVAGLTKYAIRRGLTPLES